MTISPARGIERRHDVVPGFAPNQDAAHWAGIADAQAPRAAPDLGRRRVGQIRQMAFAGVHHQKAVVARCLQHRLAGGDGALQQRHVVAQRLAEAARLEKSRCMSMMTSAVAGHATATADGSGGDQGCLGSCLGHAAPLLRTIGRRAKASSRVQLPMDQSKACAIVYNKDVAPRI